MFDIGASELLLTVIVAIVVIGPKDLPLALRTAGRWIGNIRRISNHFRAGVANMIREAELQEMEQKWREQNAAIMEAHPQASAEAGALIGPDPGLTASTDTAPEVDPKPAPKRARKPRAAKAAAEPAGASIPSGEDA